MKRIHTSGGRTVLHTCVDDYELVLGISNEENYWTAGQLPSDNSI